MMKTKNEGVTGKISEVEHLLYMNPLWQRILKKLRTLKKKIKNALNLGPNHHTLKFFFKVRSFWDQLNAL